MTARQKCRAVKIEKLFLKIFVKNHHRMVCIYIMKAHNFDTMIEMLNGQALDQIDSPNSLIEAVGQISLCLTALCNEMSKPHSTQDAEILFESLVVLSTVSMLAAAEYVLPIIEGEEVDE